MGSFVAKTATVTLFRGGLGALMTNYTLKGLKDALSEVLAVFVRPSEGF